MLCLYNIKRGFTIICDLREWREPTVRVLFFSALPSQMIGLVRGDIKIPHSRMTKT